MAIEASDLQRLNEQLDEVCSFRLPEGFEILKFNDRYQLNDTREKKYGEFETLLQAFDVYNKAQEFKYARRRLQAKADEEILKIRQQLINDTEQLPNKLEVLLPFRLDIRG